MALSLVCFRYFAYAAFSKRHTGYDTGQISDILLMDAFLKRFATCSDLNDVATCHFNTYIEGLIVALLSVGTAIGALMGAP